MKDLINILLTLEINRNKNEMSNETSDGANKGSSRYENKVKSWPA